MSRQLHILVHPPEEWVSRTLEHAGAKEGAEVVIVDLTQADPDYTHLVEQIFQSDSIATW